MFTFLKNFLPNEIVGRKFFQKMEFFGGKFFQKLVFSS